MADDPELLRRYFDLGDENAFATFVSRHLGLVYFAALRRTGGNAALAQDVAQDVFTAAARQARTLRRHDAVTGWLYTTTRFIAAKTMRDTLTRRRWEQAAAPPHDLTADVAAAEWERLRPVIDAALDELGERDRASVLLRFFEARPFADIARAAHISEDAARMRVERALARLRVALRRRGVTSTEGALGMALAQHIAGAIPAGLAATVTGAAMAGGTVIGSVTTGATLVTFLGTTKVAATLALVALTVVGFAVREERHATRAETALAEAQRKRVIVSGSLAALERRATDAERQTTRLSAPPLESTATSSSRPTEDQAKANGQALMAQYPRVKEALERWSDGQASAMFAPFFQTQGLSRAQIDRFKELYRGRFSLGWETSDDTGVTDSLHLELPFAAAGDAFSEEMKTLLGAEGFRAYRAYERMGEARDIVQRMGAALAFGETPLTSDQTDQLLRIVDAAALAGKDPSQSTDQPPEAPRVAGINSQQSDQFAAVGGPIPSFNWNLVAEHARALLSPTQFAAVRLLEAEERYNDRHRQALKQAKP